MTNAPSNSTNRVRVLILGAHPDDAEFHAGGLILRHRRAGNEVKIISVTNGAAGHHWRIPRELTEVRRAESAAVAARWGVGYDVWDFPDGELQPTLEVRRRIIREIRTFAPDLVLTHRPCDYHPDHRAVGVAVQDASYLVTVPPIVRDVPALRCDPIVAYMNDLFTKPCPFQPDVVLDTSHDQAEIVAMLACHVSQVFEWLPYNLRVEDRVPCDEMSRIAWLAAWFKQRATAIAARFAPRLECAEAYEISEYAAPLTPEARARLFPSETLGDIR